MSDKELKMEEMMHQLMERSSMWVWQENDRSVFLIDPDNKKIYAKRGPLIDLRRCVSERFFWKYCSEAQGYTASHIEELQKEVDTIPQAIVKKMTSIGTSFLFGTKEEAFRSLIRLMELADGNFEQCHYDIAMLECQD